VHSSKFGWLRVLPGSYRGFEGCVSSGALPRTPWVLPGSDLGFDSGVSPGALPRPPWTRSKPALSGSRDGKRAIDT